MNGLPFTVAVDFDMTIADIDWPVINGFKIGSDGVSPKDVINGWYHDGMNVLIWTCREKEYKDNAEKFLIANDVLFTDINENCVLRTEYWGNDSRKIGADLYIDDKNLGGIPEKWSEIDKLTRIAFEEYKNKYQTVK